MSLKKEADINKEKENKSNVCKCPFCESELEVQGLPYCKTCNVTIVICKNCGKPIPAESAICPECGQS